MAKGLGFLKLLGQQTVKIVDGVNLRSGNIRPVKTKLPHSTLHFINYKGHLFSKTLIR